MKGKDNVILQLGLCKCRYIGTNAQADTKFQSFRYSHGIPTKK